MEATETTGTETIETGTKTSLIEIISTFSFYILFYRHIRNWDWRDDRIHHISGLQHHV